MSLHELQRRFQGRREDWLSQKKGKDPPTVKSVVHNPYNSPLGLYSTENVADTLAKQTEALTEGQISTEEEDGPENLSFREKSAVFKLLEEQSHQEGAQKNYQRGSSQNQVVKPKTAPPPPPKPKPPANELILNGYGEPHSQQDYQDQHKSTRYEYQTTQKVVSQQQYHQEPPVQYSQTSVYQTSYQTPPGYQSPVAVKKSYSPGFQPPGSGYQRNQQQIYQQSNYQQDPLSPVSSYQQKSQHSYQQTRQEGPRSPVKNYQQTHQQQTQQQSSYQQQVSQSPAAGSYQQHPGYQPPSAASYQPLSQQSQTQQQSSYQQQVSQSPAAGSYQQHPGYQPPSAATYQPLSQQSQNQQNRAHQQNKTSSYQGNQYQGIQQSSRGQQTPTAVSKAEFKIGPPPPPRSSSAKQQDQDAMAAVYKQQYEQHLQQHFEQENLQMNHVNDVGSAPKAHIIKENIFENDSSSVTPITYKAPPAAPPKPNWPPPPSSEQLISPAPPSPTSMNVCSAWPPKKSTATELPKTGFNPAAVREQGTGRKCVWPPPSDEYRNGRITPQSPVGGRRIQWNPSPSPPANRRAVFGASQSPVRRKDINWPPPAALRTSNKENYHQESPRMSRKARFDDYVKEHASINVPQTYRPAPGTQHVEFY